MDDDEARARRDDDEAWERFMEAERRHLHDRRTGHLARLLDGPLPGETATEQPGRVEPQAQVGGEQEDAEPRSWWRRVFGG